MGGAPPCTRLLIQKAKRREGGMAMKKTSAPDRYDFLWRLFADTNLSSSAKCAATVMLLQYRNHRTGLCNPSYASIAKAIGLARRNAINAVRELADSRWINIESTLGVGKKNTSKITFKIERGDENDIGTGDEFDTGDSSSPVTKTTGKGDGIVPRTIKEPPRPSARGWVGLRLTARW